jgi:hypothetical protein
MYSLLRAVAHLVRAGISVGIGVSLGFCMSLLVPRSLAFAGETRTHNVVVVTADGVRWREVFAGADPALMNEKSGGIWVPAAELESRYGGADPQTRRKKLFPFIWGTLATQGQLFGNQALGSIVHTTNTVQISYPGYSEMLTGVADPQITSNEFGINPNVSVLEWLNTQAEFRGRVEVFAAWSTFHEILAARRSGLPVRAGATLVDAADQSPQGRLLTQLYRDTVRLYGDDPYDSFVHQALRLHLERARPRVLFVGFGDTDLWQHLGRYDAFLESAHAFDSFLADLWEQLQSLPEYKGQTTLIVTTDHGRGDGPVEWKEHGAAQRGSGNIWLGMLGPDVAALGERRNVAPLSQAQIAATVAALLGKDFRAFRPQAAEPVAAALPVAPAR